MTDPFSDSDYSRFAAHAWKIANKRVSFDDFEDIVIAILVDSMDAKVRLGTPLIALALTNLTRPRYFSDVIKRVERDARDFRLGTPPPEEFESSEDHDEFVIRGDGRDLSGGFEDEVALRDLIRRLPLRERQAFILCADMGYTLAEAAAMMGVSPATVGRHLAQARITLQAWYIDN